MILLPIACMLFLFLRLATGSGYENSRSLGPVMTPDFGSWQSWYQSLGLELYDLGCVSVVKCVFCQTTAAKYLGSITSCSVFLIWEFRVTVRKSIWLCFEVVICVWSFPSVCLCICIVCCLRILIMFFLLVVLCLRCRARVAPPVDEFDNELSFWDEFLPLSRQLGVEVEVELEVDLV